MKQEYAMALFGLFKMKAESAAATWFIVTDFLGMYKMLLLEKNKTAVIWRKPKAVNFPCDYVVEDLKEDRWIIQPFEEAESLTIEDLKKK